MSSFPEHEENIKELDRMGFDVSEALVEGKVTLESWGYDDLVDIVSQIICDIQTPTSKYNTLRKKKEQREY